MPKPYIHYIDGSNLYVCKKCQTHLVGLNQLVSKAYRGRTGTAYLFSNVHNVKYGDQREQNMLSGLHTVCSVYCTVCDNDKAIGWKYVKAYQQSQKFKQGRYILQRYYIKKENWDEYQGNQSN